MPVLVSPSQLKVGSESLPAAADILPFVSILLPAVPDVLPTNTAPFEAMRMRSVLAVENRI